MRRLPVYLLVDCSESMAGEPIEAVQAGIEALAAYLKTDAHALESAYLSTITFAYTAKQESPLTEAAQFQPPKVTLGSGTALGQALEILEKCLSTEVKKSTADSKGDFKPLVFILTDGEPTDFWEFAADRIKSTIAGQKAFIVALACGPDAHVQKLQRITNEVILVKNLERETIKNLFKWVSTSVATASRSLMMNDMQGISLEKLPKNYLEKFDKDFSIHVPIADRFIFLHSKCMHSREFYIMRFEKQNLQLSPHDRLTQSVYMGIASHKVESFDFSSLVKSSILDISTEQIAKTPPCPYCQNQLWAMCACGKIHCAPMDQKESITLTCPWCSKTSIYQTSSFNVGHGLG